MLARTLKFIGLAAIAAVGPLAMAQGQASRSQPIRAGIVILDSAKAVGVGGNQPLSAAPHAWFNLQSDRVTKPAGWNIYNPAAPSAITPEIYARWNLIDASTPGIGSALTKRHAAYWEVFLTQASDATLSQYDVLLLNPANYASLNPPEREKLRKFVDKGGLLWIDPGALPLQRIGQDLINNFPYAFMSQVNAGGAERSDYTQPLLSNPFPLSPGEIGLLNAVTDGTRPVNKSLIAATPNANENNTIVGDLPGEFSLYRTVTYVNNRPAISIARIGDGTVVVTARGASLKLNKPYGTTLATNTRFFAMDPNFDQDTTSAAKLAVNMISMLTEFRQASGGSRKTGSTAIDIGAPLLRRSAAASTTVTAAPAVFKGMVFAVVGDQIVAYDANPYRDLDGDGNPDDGFPDLINGGAEDVVWKSAIQSGPLTSPVCAEVPNAVTGVPIDQVLVGDATGRILIFNAAPKTAANILDPSATPWNPVAAVPAPGTANGTPNAPTVHEGLAYVADNPSSPRGRVWVVDLALGAIATSARPWTIGGGGSSPVALPEFTSSPTIGYIPIQDNSGGMDRVLYAPFKPSTSGVPSSGFISLWLGARGERPTDYEPKVGSTASALVVTTRASQQGGLPIYVPTGQVPRRVKLSLLDANGNVMPMQNTPAFGNKGMNSLFENVAPTDLGGGVLSFPFRGGTGSLPNQVAGIRIDYWIDLGNLNESSLAAIERGRVNVPDRGVGDKKAILGPVALSPAGTAFVVAQVPGNGGVNRGGVYGFREEGRGLFRMVMRWEMYENYSINRNGGDRIPYTSVLHDSDPFRLMVYEQTGLIKFTGALSKYRLVGAPVIRNGQVFVTARCEEGLSGIPLATSVPSTVLMAFKSEPEVAQIRVGDLPEGSSIIQADLARSQNLAIPEVPSTMAGANYSYDSRTGIVRFENLSSVQKGVIQNSLSLSQPILVRRPGRPDEFVEPDATAGSKWNPLLWYTVLQGLDCGNTGFNGIFPAFTDAVPANGPFVSGDTVYVAGQSLTPSFLSGSGFVPQGMVYAFRTDVGQGNPYLFTLDPRAEAVSRPAMQKVWPVAPPTRPWLSQFSQFRITANDTTPTGRSTFDSNPGFLWPLLRGTTSFDDYVVRLNQTTLWVPGAQSTTARGIVGGDGALIAWGNAGLYTFSRTDFLIADEARVAQFDPAGNIIWSASSSGTAGATGTNTSGNIRPLVKPTRAYRIQNGQYLVVDTGANRIALFDSAGVEFRSIENFRLDKAIVPAGFQQNETLTFNAPRDVLVYTTFEQPGRSGALSRGDGANVNAREYWVHYLIADSGNSRLIELVDRYSYNVNTGTVGGVVHVTPNVGADPVPQLGVLLWHSPANVSGKTFAYNSLSRVWLPTSPTEGRYVYVAGIGGGLPTRADTGLDPSGGAASREARDGNGGVVIFDQANPKGMVVINKLSLPAFDANVFYQDSTNTFASAARPTSIKLLSNVSSVTARLLPNAGSPAISIMVTDSSGVYEAVYNASATDPDTLGVQWMMPNEAYRVIRRNPGNNQPTDKNTNLRATFARRLDSGDVLIVNGYYGPRIIRTPGVSDRTPIGGEIMEVDGTLNAGGTVSAQNMGFNSRSIRFELPPIDGSRGLVIPVFADRR